MTISRGVPSATIDPRPHRDQVVGVAAGVVEIVQDEHDRAALALVEVDEQVEHLDLVGEVEVRRRLVEQHQARALGQRHGDPHPLALPPDSSSTGRAAMSSVPVASSAPLTAARSSAFHWRNQPWCG